MMPPDSLENVNRCYPSTFSGEPSSCVPSALAHLAKSRGGPAPRPHAQQRAVRLRGGFARTAALGPGQSRFGVRVQGRYVQGR